MKEYDWVCVCTLWKIQDLLARSMLWVWRNKRMLLASAFQQCQYFGYPAISYPAHSVPVLFMTFLMLAASPCSGWLVDQPGAGSTWYPIFKVINIHKSRSRIERPSRARANPYKPPQSPGSQLFFPRNGVVIDLADASFQLMETS